MNKGTSSKTAVAVVVRGGVATLEPIPATLEAMQAIVGGYVEAVALDGRFAGLTLWVNEEGRLNGMPARSCPIWKHEPNIAGDYFVTRDGADGEAVSLTVADIEALKRAFRGAL